MFPSCLKIIPKSTTDRICLFVAANSKTDKILLLVTRKPNIGIVRLLHPLMHNFFFYHISELNGFAISVNCLVVAVDPLTI